MYRRNSQSRRGHSRKTSESAAGHTILRNTVGLSEVRKSIFKNELRYAKQLIWRCLHLVPGYIVACRPIATDAYFREPVAVRD